MTDKHHNIVPITPDARSAAQVFSEQHNRELLTILFTDLVDSTKLQQEAGNVEAARLTELHRKIVRDELAKYDAREIEWAGDSCLAVFKRPSDAAVFALRLQAAHRRMVETEPLLPLVRIGIHLGEIVVRQRFDDGKKSEDLFGLQVSEASRVMSVSSGGQVFCTRAVFDSAMGTLQGAVLEDLQALDWIRHGSYLLKGSDHPVEICELGEKGLAPFAVPEPSDKCAPYESEWDALRNAPKPIRRFSIILDPNLPFAAPGFADANIAISPDGSALVYVADIGGHSQLVLHRLEALDSIPIPGTEGACQPFFSPCGNHLGFFSRRDGVLRRVALQGGQPIDLCRAPVPVGGVWGEDKYIYFSGLPGEGLQRVPESGGRSEEVVPLDRNSSSIAFGHPFVIPGKGAILYTNAAGPEVSQCSVELASLSNGERKCLVEGAVRPLFTTSGHVLCSTHGAVLAFPFDPDCLTATGPETNVIQPNMGDPSKAPMHFAVTNEGTLAYAPRSQSLERTHERTLTWVDEHGAAEPIELPARHFQRPRVAPEGKRFAVAVIESAGRSIWVSDGDGNAYQRLTFGQTDDHSPVWSADGSEIYFSRSMEGGHIDVFAMPSDGSDEPRRLTTGRSNAIVHDCTADGQRLILTDMNEAAAFTVCTLDLTSGAIELLVKATSTISNPCLSPDEKWIAYVTIESGRQDVFVRSFPELRGKWQVSPEGGQCPVWSRDGKRLIYTVGHSMREVPIETAPAFRYGAERIMFEGNYVVDQVMSRRMYDIDPVSGRFLMIQSGGQSDSHESIGIVQNWFEELKRLAPVTASN